MKHIIYNVILTICFCCMTIFLNSQQVNAYTQEEKEQAKAWLSAHGYSPDYGGASQAYQDYLNGKFDDELGVTSSNDTSEASEEIESSDIPSNQEVVVPEEETVVTAPGKKKDKPGMYSDSIEENEISEIDEAQASQDLKYENLEQEKIADSSQEINVVPFEQVENSEEQYQETSSNYMLPEIHKGIAYYNIYKNALIVVGISCLFLVLLDFVRRKKIGKRK